MDEQFNDHSRGSEEEAAQKGKRVLRSAFRRGVLAGASTVLTVLALLLLGGFLYLKNNSSDFLDTAAQSKIKLIAQMIDKYYYKEVADEAKEEGIYRGLVESTGDRYSTYLSTEELEEMKEELAGQYEGIGITLTQEKDTNRVYVVSVMEDSPSERAGLKAGDEIISADSFKASSMSLDEFVGKVRGEEGTSVHLEIVHESGESLSVDVKREKIINKSVSEKMLTEDIGLITISRFDNETTGSFKEAVKKLKKQGMKAVIYDVRANPGGLVSSVTDILDYILPEGVLVSLMDKHNNKQEFTSDEEHQLDIPAVVLISENSASAAEIFAGAMRDYKRATLIGKKTFGKGIVQETKPLSDGTAVKLTIETYYTPKGECIHEKGIKPDIDLAYEYKGDTEAMEYDYMADVQIQKAISVLNNEKR